MGVKLLNTTFMELASTHGYVIKGFWLSSDIKLPDHNKEVRIKRLNLLKLIFRVVNPVK